ncbi:MAG: radical SAM protein [Ghiorsea sp.]|nr:radical SAM protein [Ghiorsea sp.]
MNNVLSVENHDRDVVGLTYVYPVISRRAGGVSLGINLSPNNACNWQCVYCQVPNLTKGVSPVVDLKLLRQELDIFLAELIWGDYMQQHVPEACRVLQDLAISGNGEPTTCPNFAEAVEVITQLMQTYALNIPLRLITNGSSVQKNSVQQGLRLMSTFQGEIWFKVDAVGEKRTQSINQVSISPAWQAKQLRITANACPTWLQTCVFNEHAQDSSYTDDYVAWLSQCLADGLKLQGVLLYSLARPSMQKDADKLISASPTCMQDFAEKIESLGLSVKVSR